LRSAIGHILGYSMALAKAAQLRGNAPIVLVPEAFDGVLPDGIPYRPCFGAPEQPIGGALRGAVLGGAAHLPSPIAGRVLPPLRALRRALRRQVADSFGSQLDAALAKIGNTSRDLVLLHTISATNLSGLLAGLSPARFGALTVVLRHTPEEMDQIEAGPQPIAAILADLATTFGARLRLLADTEPLARLWAVTTRRSVGVVPLPVVAPPVRDLPPGQPPHLVFAGGARVEKGYGLLPALVRSLIDTVRFTIQSGPITAADDPLLQRAHRKLRALAPQPGATFSAAHGRATARAGLTLLERPLPPEEYLALLREADLLLLPYNAHAYGPRSSGILAEARAMGIPAIVPAGCWLGDQVGPDRALAFNGAAGFAPAVRHALERLPALQLDYIAAAAAWRQIHSPDALLSRLMADMT
jgi:hypothetical protein